MEETFDNGLLGDFTPQDILKAITASTQTGRDFNNTDHAIGGLKVESLDPVVKLLDASMKQYRLWQSTPRERIMNTVHEYNQLKSYGQEVGYSFNEGQAAPETDSVYRRKSVTVAFMSQSGRVTHAATIVKTANGANALATEVENKTLLLMKGIDRGMSANNSAIVPQEFNGIFKQHFDGLVELAGLETGTTAQKLDAYANDVVIIDARGKALGDDTVEAAVESVYTDRFGEVTSILGNPKVFTNYVKRFHESKRVVPGIEGSVVNATMGQSVNRIQTQFGAVNIEHDIFFDQRSVVSYNTPATSANAPTAPVPDGVAPQDVDSDASTLFTDGAGDYLYAIRAKNNYGYSAVVPVSTSAITVAGTEAVDIKFAAGAGGNAATGFQILRTKKDDVASYTTVKYYAIAEISAAELTGGYDGGAASIFRDKNRVLANTTSAIVYEQNPDILKYVELFPISRMDFAVTTPSYPFTVLNYGSPLTTMPGKIARIINLGDDITS